MRELCRECRREIVSPYETYQEKVEYVRLDHDKRALSRVLRVVCIDCVEVLRRKIDAGAAVTVHYGPVTLVDQGTLDL
jgi:hypothetical protein